MELGDSEVEIPGKENTLALLHYIGFDWHVSVAMNGVDAPVPG